MHALSTKYNILYNGQLALDKAVKGINDNTPENFWKLLPVEKLEIKEDTSKPKNADLEVAEAKATKAVQKHSMNIGGREKNYQTDEAYLLLGKARYYDQRFIPALDAFNYILYKYPNGSTIYEAKIWREKTNIRLENEALAIKNTTKLIKDNKLSKQEFADANAILATAFINIEQKDSAITKLKLANEYTKHNNEKQRYSFLLGQLYEEFGQKDSAIYFYQKVIDMNRKAERKFIIQAYAKKAQLFDYQNDSLELFVKKCNKLIANQENKPFLDVIYYHMGIFYENNNDVKLALEYYDRALKAGSTDPYLNASAYRNMGHLYFKHHDYSNAAKNYDKSLELLDKKTREYLRIQKIRKDLNEVILNEGIAKRNDSIIKVATMEEPEQIAYYEDYIKILKKADELKKLAEEKQKKINENIAMNGAMGNSANDDSNTIDKKITATSKSTNKEAANSFYFYNPNTVAYGKLEFKKLWGNRAQTGYWRSSKANATNNANNMAQANNTANTNDTIASAEKDKNAVAVNQKYTPDYYIKQLPKSQEAIDSIIKERNYTYYQLGIIYKEKFKEYTLATDKLEQLLLFNPEEKWVLPTKYNLYKIYQITDSAKAEAIKNEILTQYPDSRYAQIISNSNLSETSLSGTPEGEYIKLYRQYEEENFAFVLQEIGGIINNFSGDPIVSKFELLKAYTIGKRYGLIAYKKAMQYVADNYSNTEEGKSAAEILKTQIPLVEQMAFSNVGSKNWRIIFRVGITDEKSIAAIESKIRLFIASENIEKIYYTCDLYDEKEILISIRGVHTEEYAKFVAALFVENNKFKIKEPGIVISNENYNIIQIKKNLEEYLALKKS